MPDEKRYTARDLILAKREGFAAHCMRTCSRTQEHAQQLAEREYPLPKITRPRVVADEFGTEWRVRADADDRDTALEYRHDDCPEWSLDRAKMTRGRVALWADLLANPTEEVPDDA